jgi:hypothetical protein
MQIRFDRAAYRDRVQVETVISMVKRRLEAFVRARNGWSQRRELRLKVLTHNVMILLRVEVFYTATPVPFISPVILSRWLIQLQWLGGNLCSARILTDVRCDYVYGNSG